MYIPNETSYIVRKDLQTCPPILLQSIFLEIIITNKTSSLLDTLPSQPEACWSTLPTIKSQQ